MYIAVVDDTQADRDLIKEYMDTYLKTAMKSADVAYYESGHRFFNDAVPANLDVAFLDILIGDFTGIEIAGKIRQLNNKCLIVLNSVSKDFIHDSYDLNVLYYLIKPYKYSLFEKVMRRVEQYVDSSSRYIEVMANRKMISVNVDDILYVDKDRHSVQLHLKDGLLKVWTQTFAEVQDALLIYPQFIKCFHCILLNMKHAVQINGRDFILENGEHIPISRELVNDIHDRYTRFMFNNVFGGN